MIPASGSGPVYSEDQNNEPEIVVALRTLTNNVAALTKARAEVRAVAAGIDRQIQVLTHSPVVAHSADEWFERSTMRTQLDVDPDDGVRMLRELRVMCDSMASTYDRKRHELQEGARALLASADAEERQAYRRGSLDRLVDHVESALDETRAGDR